MKKYWKVIGIAAVAAGALYYPMMRLYKYIQAKKAEAAEDEGEHHIIKTFAPAYRGGKHNKGNHRRNDAPHTDTGTGLA